MSLILLQKRWRRWLSPPPRTIIFELFEFMTFKLGVVDVFVVWPGAADVDGVVGDSSGSFSSLTSIS
jgi:hypothetical protein